MNMNTINIYADEQHVTLTQNEFRKAVIKNSKEFIISENEKTLLREFIISAEVSLQLAHTKSAFGYKTVDKNNISLINSFHKEFFGDNYFSKEGILPYEEYERKRNLWYKLKLRQRKPIISRYFFSIAFQETIAIVPCEQMADFIYDIGIHGMAENVVIADNTTKISIHRIGASLDDDFSFVAPVVSLEKAFKLVAETVLR